MVQRCWNWQLLITVKHHYQRDHTCGSEFTLPWVKVQVGNDSARTAPLSVRFLT